MAGISMRMLILLLFLFSALSNSTHANTLTGTLTSKSVLMRDGGFIPMEFRLQYDGRGFVEGRLEVEIIVGDEIAGRVRSQELVLTPGVRQIPLLIPPLSYSSSSTLYARLRFVAKDRTWELGDHLFADRGMGKTTLVLGTVLPDRNMLPIDDEWQQSLRLESVYPEFFIEAKNHMTGIERLETEQMPVRTLDYCRFDLLSINSASFAAAKEKQLDALLRWVEAGGSVCVCIAGVTLDEHHTKFLARLSGAGNSAGTKPDASLTRHHVELGRAVIISEPVTTAFLAGNAWKAAAGFLWKLHNEIIVSLENKGVPPPLKKEEKKTYRYWGSGKDAHVYTISRLMEEMAQSRGDFLTQIPTWAIISLLAGFLILIGPGDYFVLGWLRRRRWTWILFLILCGACTWSISALADYYLGTSDRRQVIRLVDLSADGRVLREVRYEMSFSAKNRVFQTTVKSGNVMPMKNQYYGYERRQNAEMGATEWQGSSSQTYYQPMGQWTLSTIRITSFPEATDDSEIPWQRLRLEKHKDKLVLNEIDAGQSGFNFRLNTKLSLEEANWGNINLYTLERLMSIPPAGFFHQILSQQSPHLDPILGDLAHEGTVKEGWNHVVAWRKTYDGIHLYRRPVKMEIRP